MQFDSLDFYREHAERYSELSHEFTHSVYTGSSHSALNGDMDLLNRMAELAPGNRGLDAGCGAGARDVYLLHTWGGMTFTGSMRWRRTSTWGKKLHPEIADNLQVADLKELLPFDKASFDFVLCNAVIQHLSLETTEITTIPELTRVLAPGGVLQLMFKIGSGVATVSDRAYGPDSVDRSFQLYDEYRLLKLLEDCNCSLIEPDGSGSLGGMLYFSDPKPMRYCAFWVRKN